MRATHCLRQFPYFFVLPFYFLPCLSRFGRKSQNDIEPRRQFADARPFDGSEIDDYGFAGLRIANASENHVALVSRIAFDIALRGELVAPFHLHGEVNVRSATGIWNRLDGAEQVFARRAGQEATEPLKVRVSLVAIDAARVEISAVVIDLPDFHDCASDGLAAAVEYAPAQIGDGSDGGGDRIVDHEQIVIRIERHAVGIKRPFGLPRRLDQLIGENVGRKVGGCPCGSGCQASEETPTCAERFVYIHAQNLPL